jgi:hypothetical protein
VEVTFLSQKILFSLDLSAQDMNHLKRLMFSYLHIRGLEGRRLEKMSQVSKANEELSQFLEDFLQESLVVQQRLVDLIKDFVHNSKIVLMSDVRDKDGVRLTSYLLVSHPAFYELLMNLAEKIALWEEFVQKTVKKKRDWRSWFVSP